MQLDCLFLFCKQVPMSRGCSLGSGYGLFIRNCRIRWRGLIFLVGLIGLSGLIGTLSIYIF